MWYAIRDWILSHGYSWVMKPIFFRRDPEDMHNQMVSTGANLGRSAFWRSIIRFWFDYDHPMLRTNLAGVDLKNPIGLAAGFDKEGVLTGILGDVGFGFQAIGSVTGAMTPGNPKPRLWRLPKSKSLVVHFGLKSSGSEQVAKRLATAPKRLPISLSIAKANIPGTDDVSAGIADYVMAARNMHPYASQWEINISCPNTSGGEPFAEADHLDQLLAALMPVIGDRPTYVKLPSDLSTAELDSIIEVAERNHITGFICTNLLKKRTTPLLKDADVPSKGGLSGKVLEPDANSVLAYVYKRTKGKMPLIGVGGIFTAEDAYEKIRLGASAVELITGMIYGGPSAISQIKRGLVRLLLQDNFSKISDAVGADIR